MGVSAILDSDEFLELGKGGGGNVRIVDLPGLTVPGGAGATAETRYPGEALRQTCATW